MSNEWTRDELKAAVEAYLDMQKKDNAGDKFVKKQYYQDLSEKFGRTAKSYEYRFQNISYVFSLMGRQWVTGLKPARNVGTNKIIEIEELINEVEGNPITSYSEIAFQNEVLKSYSKPILGKPVGHKKPTKQTTTATQYNRDSDVVAWVLQQAENCCEKCDSEAPFSREDGTPYLEVHHVIRLADGGQDTADNAVALCPNCHRELHFGLNKKQLTEDLYRKVKRLSKK